MNKLNQAHKREKRAREKIKRLSKIKKKISVFRSNKFIWAQIIDLDSGKTLISFSTKSLRKMEEYKNKKLTKTQEAFEVGRILAQKAKTKKIQEVVFDKGRYSYHGRVKALAEGARSEGLKF